MVSVIGLFGVYAILTWIWFFITFTWKHSLRWIRDFRKHYAIPGKEPYALVTGGSDGIGERLCHLLAARGFNIVMVARNQAKMDEKIAAVKAKYPQQKYVTIVADFSKMHTIKEYRDIIGSKVKDLDIAMLFLNAGVAQMGPFADLDDSHVENLMNVNACHPMYLAKALINQMAARKQKSAIVVTSSVFGARPVGGASIVYSATKSLASFLAVGLSYEQQGKIDVLAWEAGEISTKMSKKKVGMNVLSVHEACVGMLKDIGRERVTNGNAIHDMLNRALNKVPLKFINKMFIGIGTSVLKKQRARDPQVVEKKTN